MSRPALGRTAGALLGAALALAAGASHAVVVKPGTGELDAKEFFRPELSISSENVALADIRAELPNAAAWDAFLAARAQEGKATDAFIDPRSGTATNLVGAFPVIPGSGDGNDVTLEDLSARLGRPVSTVDASVVADAVTAFVRDHRELFAVDPAQLGSARAERVNADLWHVSIPQIYEGNPVRHGRIAAAVSHGNLVVVGTESWGNVRDVRTSSVVSSAGALDAGFAYAGGRSTRDEIVREPTLEVVPFAPPEHQSGEAFVGHVGSGYGHRLVWSFTFRRSPDPATWEALVDAATADVVAFQDVNQYAASPGLVTKESITGGVYPLTSTEICPSPQTCGAMQHGWPMPFADTGVAISPFANSAGIFDFPGGVATTTLTGKYVKIIDTCGVVTETAQGSINMGGANGDHDCEAAGFSAGNTSASRSAFYEVNKIAEMARGWLPGNLWLQAPLPTIVNLPLTCNAFWVGNSINFFRSGGGCRNTGEIAAVFDHEWGHGLDDNDTSGNLSNSSEAYADIAAIYRLQASCVGYGFFWTRNNGCGQTADGTGFNADEAQVGAAHCDLDCSGVRDADYLKHNPNTPDTALGFVCNSCDSGPGPCGRQVHCAAAPSRQAAWDLVARDLRASPFNLNSQSAFLVGNKLFYQGSGNIGAWHACTCGQSSNGCGAANGYMQWLAADDDNGNVNDGTPHMTALHAAFNRHGIACASPAPVNRGCAGAPGAPTLAASPGNFQVALSWNAVAGADRYWVLRTEGHAGCEFGKTKIAELGGTTYTDRQVANGRAYHYNVVAVKTSAACYSPVSNCVSATPRP